VENDFSSLLKNKNKETGLVNFYGNVEIGKDITFSELQENYSGLIFSYGACDENILNIPNEENFGSFSARKFVNWYNTHIDYVENSPFMTPEFDLSNINDVIIIGNGNVAMDIARLLTKPFSMIRKFDINEKILEKFAKNKVKNIHIIARRGLVQSAFTVKELRELNRASNNNIYMLREEIESSLNENSEIEMNDNNPGERRQYVRKVELVKQLNIIDSLDEMEKIQNENDGEVKIFFRFLLTPTEILVDETQEHKPVKSIKFLRSYLEGKPKNQINVINEINKNSNKRTEFLFDTKLVLKSIGYKVQNLFPSELSFDNKNITLKNRWGVLYNTQEKLYDNIFSCGWVKRGAKGIVDSTLRDSYDTFTSIEYNLENEKIKPKIFEENTIRNLLEKRRVKFIDNEKWFYVDNIELERGKKLDKLREKIFDKKEFLDLVK
jgi:NADPH-dependent glutamate synthase beta subunit-like oxidoreductase